MERKPALVLMGTPEFSVPAFTSILESPDYEVRAVITQADKPSGRGLALHAPPVRRLGERFGRPVFQPKTLRGLELQETGGRQILQSSHADHQQLTCLLNGCRIDAFIVIAYGKILPQALISFARCGALNVHASLLPRWRGAAPIQQALLAGDQQTGVCLMKMDAGLDTGPLYASAATPIGTADNFGTLHDRLAALGAELLLNNLPAIIQGKLTATPQSTAGATYAEKWTAEDARLRWHETADRILARIRACSPMPGARSELRGESVKIFSAHRYPGSEAAGAAAGMVVEVTRSEIVVATGDNQYIYLDELQLAGRRRLSAPDFIRGRLIAVGDIFC